MPYARAFCSFPLAQVFLTKRFFFPSQMDRDVEVINVAHLNTVRTLRDQLARVDAAGYADTGFPIIRTDEDGRAQMLGFIGGNELEHALSASPSTHSPIYTAFTLVLIFFFLLFRHRRRGSGSSYIICE